MRARIALKRSAVAAYDLAACLAVSLLLASGFADRAFAYVDPSVMTYTIQAVAGVVVALSAVAGVALRRGRKQLMRLLDIDENHRREIEPDVHRTDKSAAVGWRSGSTAGAGAYTWAAAVESTADGGRTAVESGSGQPSEKRKVAYKPSWKERLAHGLIAAFFFTFTIYFVAPLEIVAGSSNDLVFTLGDVWWVPVLPCLGLVAGITLVLSLLRGRAFAVGLALVFGVGLCAYVQALFLNVGLPAANGATILWMDYLGMQVASSIVWAAILIAAVVYCVRNSRRMQGVVALVSVALVIVQGVGLASMAIAGPSGDDRGQSTAKAIMTEDQLFTANPNQNVIVFILDTYDTAYLDRVMKMNPHLLDGLTGFTYYRNATSATIPTRFAIPEMMTGQMPSFDEPYSAYKRERYARSTFLQDIHDAGYSIGLYTDSLRISDLPKEEQQRVTDKTVNIHGLPNSMLDYGGALYSLWQMGQYRDVLWPFKWAFWYYTDQINTSMAVYDPAAAPDETIYAIDDVRYYNRLCDIGLSVEEGDYQGGFRFIHLLGSHYPFSYDEEVNDLGDDNSDVFKQSQGAIHIVEEYIDQLKELGLYDQTTIIVTADHGYWTITLDPIEETSTPIMFVKPAQSAELDALPIVTDEKPVSHLDLQATVLDAMGLDYSEYSERDEWAGYSMFGDIPADRVRHYLTTDSEPDLTAVRFREYEIAGDALDWDNWRETGRFIEPIEQE